MSRKPLSEHETYKQLRTILDGFSDNMRQDLINQEIQELEFDLFQKQLPLIEKINKDNITLNVGGKLFTTSLKTLRSIQDSKLDKLFTGRLPILVDENGHFFLDRNPEYFPYVLEYLRDGSIIFPKDGFLKKMIINELKHFECSPAGPSWQLDVANKPATIELSDDQTTAWKTQSNSAAIIFGTDEFVFGVYEWDVEIIAKVGFYGMAFGVGDKSTLNVNLGAITLSKYPCITTQGASYILQPSQIQALTSGDIIHFTFDADKKELEASCSNKGVKCKGIVSGTNLYPFFYLYSIGDKIKLHF